MHRTKLPNIPISKIRTIGKMKNDMGMLLNRVIAIINSVTAFHSQMRNKDKPIHNNSQKFTSTAYSLNMVSHQLSFKSSDIIRPLNNSRQ
ncbi:hypothetical protein D3C75_1225000 [compost metagenome]